MSVASTLRRLLGPLVRWRRHRPEDHLSLGAQGERVAVRALRRAGHRVLRRNYRCPAGEIDLITADAGELVFVEVKTRTSAANQDPSETVSRAKWHRIEGAARYYLLKHASGDPPCRFDLVTVVWPVEGKPIVEHSISAYEARRR